MLIEAKSNLARLMATENLIIEERNVETAFFDIKSRILTVPILNGNLSAQLYDLLLGHEVGHALETPASGWHDSVIDHKVNKSILNVCEDVRIEKKMKRKFPGLKLSFTRGYKELMDMDFFGVNGVDLNTLNFIDRVNLHTKGGASQGINFNAEEGALLSEIESTETWEEVVIVARKVQEFMKLENEKKKRQVAKESVKDSDEKTGQTKKSESGETQPEQIVESDDVPENGTNSQDEESDVQDVPPQETENASSNSTDASNERSEPKSETDETFRKRESELYKDDERKDIIYSTIPKTINENIIIPYKEILETIESYNSKNSFSATPINHAILDANFVKFKNESSKVVSYLVKEFEMKKNAEQQKKASVSKTGDLNMNRIYDYKLTDDIFKRLTNVPNGKSHGLVMFVDWSGSMADHIQSTIRQLLNLVMFCKKVNIPFEVYAFTTQWPKLNRHGYHLDKQNPKVGDLVVNAAYSLMNLLSNRMTTKEYMTMAKYLLDVTGSWRTSSKNYELPDVMTLGGTPLNSAIISAFDIVPQFKENNKLQIVNTVFLTDGESGQLDGRFSYIDPRKGYHHSNSENIPSRVRRSIFRDEVTKATEEVKYVGSYGGNSTSETTALLKLLKQRCDCNIIGFFIGTSRNMNNIFGSNAKDDLQFERWKTEFRTKGYVVLKNSGYDEYYLLRSQSLDLDESELEVKSDTTRGFVNAFHKYVGNKVSSRIILNRFIGLIA